MTTPTASGSAAIYTRRSSAKDLGKNHSLAEQETDCRALAARLGLDVVAVFQEKEGTGASARSRKARPRWRAALDALDSGADFETLIVWSLDRAERRGADELASLLTRHAASGRRIVTVDGVDTSDERQRLATIIRGEIAREEAENIAKRVARTKASRRADGRWLGGRPPFGLLVEDGRVAPDPATAPLARRIADEVLSGATLWSIARTLNDAGTPSPTGKEWRVNTIAQMLRAPAFAGLQSTRARDDKGRWSYTAEVFQDPETREPVSVGRGIVTPTERSLILAALASRTEERAHGVTRGRKPMTTVTGPLIRCASCGSRAASSGGAQGSYRCANLASAKKCEAPFTAPREGLDDYVAATLLSRLSAMEPDDEALLAIAERWTVRADPATAEERTAADARVQAVDADLARARRLAVSGVLTEDEAAEEIARLRKLRAQAESALAKLPALQVDVSPLLDIAESYEAWNALDVPERRDLLAMAIAEVRVSRASGRGVRFNPDERVSIHWL